MSTLRFNTPPGWPLPPPGWVPPAGWQPHADWPPAPPGWQFWVIDQSPTDSVAVRDAPVESAPTVEAVTEPSAGTPDQAAEPSFTDSREGESASAPSSARALDLTSKEGRTEREVEPSTPSRPEAPEPVTAVAPAPVPLRESSTLSELDRVKRQRDSMAKEIERLRNRVEGIDTLTEVGIYQLRHPLDSSAEYKEELASLREEIKEIIRGGSAIEASDMFAYNNSLAQGRRMVGDLSKLMLRAYNAEAENCVRTVRAGSVSASVARLKRAVDAIAKLGKMMEMQVAEDFHALRIREIEMTGDFLMKVQMEREAAREERERLREERRAEMELAAERERLQKERQHYSNALAALIAQGKTDEVAQLEQRIGDINSAIEENDYRAANIRAGYVYVISNIGTFGPDVVKIGMTRRLEPLDRIRELGDASVPFPFDVHAIYFSDDAVGLENALHKAFAEFRLNQVNLRREFFYATPEEVREVLATHVGNLLEFTEEPEAEQYHQSVTIREQLQVHGPASAGIEQLAE